MLTQVEMNNCGSRGGGRGGRVVVGLTRGHALKSASETLTLASVFFPPKLWPLLR